MSHNIKYLDTKTIIDYKSLILPNYEYNLTKINQGGFMKVLVFLTSLIVSNVYAADSSSGCGPGWFVFKENSLISSALRATTNGVLFPTTTLGMTLGTSNCSKHKIVMKEKESLHFVTNNYFELKNEAASGRGEFITAFTETLGCQQQGAQIVAHELQKNYQHVFKHDHNSPNKVLLEVYKIILSKPSVAKFCSSLV